MVVLLYLFWWVECVIEDCKLMLIIIDEVWKVLDNLYFVDWFSNWLVMVCKQNVVVVMMI